MNKKKFATALASAALAASFIVAPVAPANALTVLAPQGPRATICYYFPWWC
ncbi:hypothetical protein ACH9EU_07200 [Kocuria sp. M1R5S2]|uniref:hypothetical protein n=1 Tax=Kocuria rhizosphaerae TaxID=3376285 RepID=UPI00379928CA